jgi:protein-S-isoprenylcysteine O-methyltransferase Ste14
MLAETLTAAFLGACLGIFYTVNLFNLLRNRGRRKTLPAQTEPQPQPPEPTKSLPLTLIALGTFVFWFGSVFYVILVLTGIFHSLDSFLFPLRFPLDSYSQIFGIIITALGYFIFTWSVVARGRYATAWDMPENHKLVTWGPYHYVRHPSYLSYFLMFFGLFCIWLTWIALIPFVAILGYLKIVNEEEKMLVQRFGDEYITYQRTVAKFFPKLRTTEE